MADQADGWDSGDLDALDELKRSRGYELVRARMEHELERNRKSLELDSDLATACGLRGYIRALRTVLQIPEILQEEIAGQIKEQRT